MSKIDLIMDSLIAFNVMAHEQKIPVYIEESNKAIVAACELKAENQELVEALKSVHSICKSDLQYRQFPSSREYEIINICKPLIAKHKEQA